MRARDLSFTSLATPLAQCQTQAVIDRVQAMKPRVTCQLAVLPPTAAATGRDDESFVALSRAEMSHLTDLLAAGQARLVVAEAADVSLPLPNGLAILCVPDRAAPFDAYLNRQGLIMDEMEPGSRIGVLGARSRSQLAAVWPELSFRILRGGVDRAMEIHLRGEEVDGLILPAAVTEHLGIQGIVAEIFAPEFVLPSPGQGILVVLGRDNDLEAREILANLHSEATAIELAAELAFRSRMISDRDLPVGALAKVEGDELCIAGATGAGYNRVVVTGGLTEAEAVGAGLAQQILSSGESFADLLEADFPEGLPESELDLAGESEDEDEEIGAPAADYDDEFASYDAFDELDPAVGDEEADDHEEDELGHPGFKENVYDEDDYD